MISQGGCANMTLNIVLCEHNYMVLCQREQYMHIICAKRIHTVLYQITRGTSSAEFSYSERVYVNLIQLENFYTIDTVPYAC